MLGVMNMSKSGYCAIRLFTYAETDVRTVLLAAAVAASQRQ
jgi:hypothetical protein